MIEDSSECKNLAVNDTEAINEIAQELEQVSDGDSEIDEAVHIDEYTVPEAREWKQKPEGEDEREPEEIFAVLEQETDELQPEEEDELFPVLEEAEK